MFLQKNYENRLLPSSCVSVRPSVRLHGTTRLLLEGVSRNLIFENFSKICREKSSFINLVKTKRNPLYISNHSVPRCEHFPPRL